MNVYWYEQKGMLGDLQDFEILVSESANDPIWD